MRPGRAAAALALLVAGPADAAPSQASLAALRDGDCALCHEVPGIPRPDRTASCSGCHAWIRRVADDPAKRERALELFPLWERYERVTHSFVTVPSLTAAMARLDPEWVAGWLADPHDLRPSLPEMMPRFDLDAEQRAAIAAAFVDARVDVPATPRPDPLRAAAGEGLFTARGCAGCHAFGARHTQARVPLAPDLAHARDRLDPDMAAAWIADPGSVSPDATMPSLGLPVDEVLALRDYLLLADPGWREPAALATSVAPTTEPVVWAQVEERVFGRICVHCHMDPAQNDGRAGPGNAGGFGFPATGLALQTRDQVAAAADRIPDALSRRRHEAARDVVAPGERPADLTRPEIPGMPMALPPLSDEDLALVLGWISQGMP